MENNKQIPLLAKLGIWFPCDKCKERVTIYPRNFYLAIESLINDQIVQDNGELICPKCRDCKAEPTEKKDEKNDEC